MGWVVSTRGRQGRVGGLSPRAGIALHSPYVSISKVVQGLLTCSPIPLSQTADWLSLCHLTIAPDSWGRVDTCPLHIPSREALWRWAVAVQGRPAFSEECRWRVASWADLYCPQGRLQARRRQRGGAVPLPGPVGSRHLGCRLFRDHENIRNLGKATMGCEI